MAVTNCEECGAIIEWTRGRRPRMCEKHRENNFVRASQSRKVRTSELAVEMAPLLAGASQRKSLPERMAIGLSITPTLRLAADAAGLRDIPDSQLPELARQAREQHKPLIERKVSATAEMFQQFISLAILRLRDSVDEMNPAQLALAVRSAVQALTMYQGGAQAAYTAVTMHWPGKTEMAIVPPSRDN